MSHEDDVLAANQAFYDAFDRCDLAAMDDLWARAPGSACVHPGWAALDSRSSIMESWRAILEPGNAPAIRCSDPRVTMAGDMAFVVCTEVLSGGDLVATNIFVREDGAWKICHHHASPVARRIVVERPPPEEMN